MDAVQLFGRYGDMKDYPVEGVLRGARIVRICEDTNQIQDNELAQALITRAARH